MHANAGLGGAGGGDGAGETGGTGVPGGLTGTDGFDGSDGFGIPGETGREIAPPPPSDTVGGGGRCRRWIRTSAPAPNATVAPTTSAATTAPKIAPRPTTPHYANLAEAVFACAQPASMASNRRVNSSGEPTLMRTDAGSPNGPSGRTITPCCSRRAANAAPSPTSTQRKFATPMSGAKPRSRSPAARRSRPSRVSLRLRATSSPAPRLASAASSADCVTSNAFLTFRQAAAMSGGQSP